MTTLTIEIPEKVGKTLSDLVVLLGGRIITLNANGEKLKRRAEFLEQKRKRREAEAKTTEQIIERAREIFSTPASKEFFRKLAEEQEKNKAI